MGTGERRVRRTAEEARRHILDAAEKRLRDGGPDAIRLKEIAADVGIAHPTILHHFQSRDGLIQAMQDRAIERLQADLVASLQAATPDENAAAQVMERIFATLADAGLARLLAWRVLALPGPGENDHGESTLRDLTDLVHARRTGADTDVAAPPHEDSEFIVRLTAAAMLGEGIFGPFLDCWLNDGEDTELRRRFRAWFSQLLLDHINR